MTPPPPNPRSPLTLCSAKCACQPRLFSIFTPADFCGVTPALVAALAQPESATRVLASAAGLTVTGAALYGFAFGLWRAPVQGLMSAVMGFVGCQLSWLLSPFLGDPVSPPHWVARLYWQYNFYEYVWLCVQETSR